MAVAYALINGVQLMQCVAPTPSERVCAVYSEAMDNLHVMDDYGRFEVSCLFYASSDIMPSITFQRPHIAQLVVDGRVIDLGKVPGGEVPAVCVTRYVAEYPKIFELRVQYSDSARYHHPDERLLVDEVRETVSDHGLHTTTTYSPNSVHNRVKDLELYARVIRTTSFKAMISNHPDRVAMEHLPNGQFRVVPAEDANKHVSAGAREIDGLRKSHEERIVAKLTEILEQGDLDFRVVFQHMAQLPEFKATLAGSTAVLSRFLLTRPEVFWFRQDAQHTTRVGLACNH
jgi:hypothetical protein